MSAPKPGEYGEPWKYNDSQNYVHEVQTGNIICDLVKRAKPNGQRITERVNVLSGLDPAGVAPLIEAAKAVLYAGAGDPGHVDNVRAYIALRAALKALVVSK